MKEDELEMSDEQIKQLIDSHLRAKINEYYEQERIKFLKYLETVVNGEPTAKPDGFMFQSSRNIGEES